MSDTTAIEKAAAAPAPRAPWLGQATAIEQSRAIAEVQAAIIVAQQNPRSIQAAEQSMRESCAQRGLAERAFYRYNRGGSAVSGPSIHLARELARCWGNIQYGIAELRRDDDQGISEMQAYAWDVQTNTRSAQIFIVPHKRDKTGGPVKLVDLRDIYENNSNNGARRLRQAIFSVLPPWFVEEAQDRCTAALKDGGGKPLPVQRADAVAAFKGIGVTTDQLEQKLGRVTDRWTEHDIAQLQVIFRSIDRNEITAEEEFPEPRVTGDEIAQAAAARTVATPAQGQPADDAEPQPEGDNTPTGEVIRRPQQRKMHALFNELGITDRDKRLAMTSTAVGRQTDSANDLTVDEATTLIDRLEDIKALDPEEQPLVIAEMADGFQDTP